MFVEKLDLLAPKIKGKHGTHLCQECNSTFVNFGNLKAHTQAKHPGKSHNTYYKFSLQFI